jgi:hypothetical protein
VEARAKEGGVKKTSGKPILNTRQLADQFGIQFATVKPATDKTVGITIRVKESHRAWWNAQAKLQRVTLTDVIVNALTRRFGTGDEQ